MTASDTVEEDDDERRFWRALRGGADRSAESTPSGTPVPEATPDPPPAPEPDAGTEVANAERAESRRLALRNMLRAAEARVDRVSRARRPVLAGGAVVRATRGELAGRTGVVLDADYIESRVLLDLGPDEPHRWLPFAHVGPPD